MADNPAPAAAPSDAEKAAASQRLERLFAGGVTPPQARNMPAPADQKWLAYFNENNVLMYAKNDNYDENAPKLTVYGSGDSGYFRLDNQGNAVLVQQPNADAVIDKAVTRQVNEAQRNERQANADAGKGYMTTLERTTLEQKGQQLGQSQEQINQQVRQFDITARQNDEKQATADRTAASNIAVNQAQIGQIGAQTGLIGAQTTQTGAQTQQTAAQTAALQAKTPAEIAETNARTAQIAQQTEEAKRKAGLPTIPDLGQGPTYATMGPTGQIEERVRQGYVPKTLAEVQARVGQLQAAYNAKKAELGAKVGANYTAEQADKELGAWYDQNVTPQQQALQAAQEEALYARGKDEAAARTSAYTAAQAAGTQQINAFNAMKGNVLGPGAAEGITGSLNALRKSGGLGERDYSWLVTQGPNLQVSAQEATDKALAQLSPTAAQRTGQPMPNYAGVDIAGQLNQMRYTPPAAAGPPPPPTPVPAGGPPPNYPANIGAFSGAMPKSAAPISMPDWLRGDQAPSGAMEPANGPAGGMAPGQPQYMGSQATPEQIAAAMAASQWRPPA